MRPRLERIDWAVGRMDRLISQLVDGTRIGHGELTVSTRPEPVGAILAETVDLYSPDRPGTRGRGRGDGMSRTERSCRPIAIGSCRSSATWSATR